jgi:NADH-quinone oxidoreductase subunit A
MFVALLVVTAVLVLALSYLMSPHDPNPRKAAPFECGQTPSGKGRMRMFMQYYPYLLTFLLFDLISMFLYAWALALEILPAWSTWFVVFFLAILALPLYFALHLTGKRELW